MSSGSKHQTISSTDRFHVSVRPFIDHRCRPKCIKDKKWVCYWGSHHTTFWSKFVIYKWRDARQHGIYWFYTRNFEQKRKNDKLASCRIAWLFEDLCQTTSLGINIFRVKNATFLLCFFFSSFLLYLTCRQFLPKVSQGLHQLKADWSFNYFQNLRVSRGDATR